MRKYLLLIIPLLIINLFCVNRFNEEINHYFQKMKKAYQENDGTTYYVTLRKIFRYPDSYKQEKL